VVSAPSADTDLRIKLPVFEGPLDLLLFLIRKNELDIYDIPIAQVTTQYIHVLRSIQSLDLEIAGEFFVMAASLMEIKSRMLLPRGAAASDPTSDDDALDPRWELVHQLLQYKKFKEAAAKLDELHAFQRDMLARRMSMEAPTEQDRPLQPVDRIEVWNVFNIVLRRLAEKLVVGEIKDEQVTVADKMEELLQFTRTQKRFVFTALFEGQTVTVRVLVATFIAVLELTRLRKLRITQNEAYTDIIVIAVEDDEPPPAPIASEPPAATLPTERGPRASPAELDAASTSYATIPAVLDAAPEVTPKAESPAPTATTAASQEVDLTLSLEPPPALAPAPAALAPAGSTQQAS
jgi:segregation and condensation protein A